MMSSSDMEIQFLLNRFIVKNMVGKSSLIVSNVECLVTDHCDFKCKTLVLVTIADFSNLLVQNSVVTYFDASCNAISRHGDVGEIFASYSVSNHLYSSCNRWKSNYSSKESFTGNMA